MTTATVAASPATAVSPLIGAMKDTVNRASTKNGGLVYQIRQLSQAERQVVQTAFKILKTPGASLDDEKKARIINAILVLGTDKIKSGQYSFWQTISNIFNAVFSGRITSSSLNQEIGVFVASNPAPTAVAGVKDPLTQAREYLEQFKAAKAALPADQATANRVGQELEQSWNTVKEGLNKLQVNGDDLAKNLKAILTFKGGAAVAKIKTSDPQLSAILDSAADELVKKIRKLSSQPTLTILKEIKLIVDHVTRALKTIEKTRTDQNAEKERRLDAQITSLEAAINGFVQFETVPNLKDQLTTAQAQERTLKSNVGEMSRIVPFLQQLEGMKDEDVILYVTHVKDILTDQKSTVPAVAKLLADLTGALNPPAASSTAAASAPAATIDVSALKTIASAYVTAVGDNQKALTTCQADIQRITQQLANLKAGRIEAVVTAPKPVAAPSPAVSVASTSTAPIKAFAQKVRISGVWDDALIAEANSLLSEDQQSKVFGRFYDTTIKGTVHDAWEAGRNCFLTAGHAEWNGARAGALETV